MQAATPGRLTFGAAKNFVGKIGLVDDGETEDAAYGPLSLTEALAEPSGAPPLLP